MSLRVTFLVDGFNLYHSLRAAQDKTGKCCKWLNIRALCESYLKFFGRDAVLEEIYYFSAYASHLSPRNPDVVTRHQILVRALESTGIRVEMAQFKRKNVHCTLCNGDMVRYEEKETDVAIAVRLVELVVTDKCDVAIVVTGDTDIVPGIRTAKRLASTKRLCVIAPYRRANAELKQIADQYFKLKAESYGPFLFPNEIELTNGQKLAKPTTW
jgi:uncharacterized LabA/DUF88 family protein